MKKFMIWLSLLIITILFFYTCKLPQFENESENIELNESYVEEVTELFVKENNSEKYIFNTNEEKYLTNKGYTIWTTTSVNTTKSFENIEWFVQKESGNEDAGFGLVFCEQDIEDKKYMLCVMINTQRQYIIGEVKDGNFITLIDWKSSPYLNKGFGIKNKINISFNEEKKYFEIKFNDVYITEFKSNENIKFENSKRGFVVVISNAENFPQESVKVIFEQ